MKHKKNLKVSKVSLLMIYIEKEYSLDGEDFIVIQLFTSCCKDLILFKKIGLKTYFNMALMEPCPPGWNQLIEEAIKNKSLYNK